MPSLHKSVSKKVYTNRYGKLLWFGGIILIAFIVYCIYAFLYLPMKQEGLNKKKHKKRPNKKHGGKRRLKRKLTPSQSYTNYSQIQVSSASYLGPGPTNNTYLYTVIGTGQSGQEFQVTTSTTSAEQYNGVYNVVIPMGINQDTYTATIDSTGNFSFTLCLDSNDYNTTRQGFTVEYTDTASNSASNGPFSINNIPAPVYQGNNPDQNLQQYNNSQNQSGYTVMN